MKRITSLLIALMMIIVSLSGSVSAFACLENTKYLAFASDRHGNTEAIATAMTGMPSSVEYVSMIGDMVDKTNDFNTSEVMGEINSVFPKLTAENTSIVYGSHDANAVDDAGIMKCTEKNSSSLIYTGYEKDKKTVAYYIYAAAYDDMMDEDCAKEQAKAFESWIDTVDKKIPVIVLCHVPLHAKRGDNFGASYWNLALNYAATGSETTEEGATVIRNVAFLHGHNHTVEAEEYYLEPNSTLSVQVPKSESSAKLKGGKSKAEGADSVIYYTYVTAGYLKSDTTVNALLIGIDNHKISFTKYQNGSPTLLGSAERVNGKRSVPAEEADNSAEKYIAIADGIIIDGNLLPVISK